MEHPSNDNEPALHESPWVSNRATKMGDGISAAELPKILLIDDDPVFRSVLVKLGPLLGLEVDAIETLLELDPFSRINRYDGAIVDLYLGQQDGLDLVSHLRSFFGSIPTVLVSADAGALRRSQDQEHHGVRDFASKSMGAVKILEMMKRLVGHKISAG
jgi:CheY-like chemotaxis protein